MAETSKITESCANTANMSETCIVSASRNDIITRLFLEGPRKWNCAIFCGKANSLVLLSKKKKNPTAFDLEYLKAILDSKAKRKDEGSRRKDRPTSRQE